MFLSLIFKCNLYAIMVQSNEHVKGSRLKFLQGPKEKKKKKKTINMSACVCVCKMVDQSWMIVVLSGLYSLLPFILYDLFDR